MLCQIRKAIYINRLYQLVFETTLKDVNGNYRCLSMTGVSNSSEAESICSALAVGIGVRLEIDESEY